MFAKKAQAEALVLDRGSPGKIAGRDLHGVDWEHRRYILEVRPPGSRTFRVETEAKVPIFSKPGQGDVVKVSYDPKNYKTEIEIEGDPRYDPAPVRAATKQQEAARRGSVASRRAGARRAGAAHAVNALDDERRCVVRATCPECGARVDESAH